MQPFHVARALIMAVFVHVTLAAVAARTQGDVSLVKHTFPWTLAPPTQLATEYLPSPAMGVAVLQPRFTFAIEHDEQGVSLIVTPACLYPSGATL